MRRFSVCFLPILLLAVLLSSCENKQPREVSVLPRPSDMKLNADEFVLSGNVGVTYNDESLAGAADYLIQSMAKEFSLTISDSGLNGDGNIVLKVDSIFSGVEGAYSLNVNDRKVELYANSYNGIINAISTLRQLVVVDGDHCLLQGAVINDAPRYQWRGLMLDSSRHFWTVDEVKHVLDMMAMYKMNKFHWHLTDDQGWRLEIKKYPLLTEKGAYRKYNWHDLDCIDRAEKLDNPDFLIPEDKVEDVNGEKIYGGYYTQDDAREIVAYAASLGIDVIPEIDMPGHFLAAINNYPELACSGRIGWGETFSSPICPGKDATIEFCKDIYREVFDIFPYEYVHLGADEVEKTNWKACKDCQKRIKDNNLADEKELQSWFVHQMEAFFNENGRKLIGWDEIIEGGLSETATIAWWRSWNKEALPEATQLENEVIACPNTYFYLDVQQDSRSLLNTYSFDVENFGLSAEQLKFVKGVQANIWTEWIPSMKRMEYMIFPRLWAVSEIGWCDKTARDEQRFLKDIVDEYARLDRMGINYRLPDLEGVYDTNVFVDSVYVKLSCLLPNVEIRYTTDGTFPTLKSALYKDSLLVDSSYTFIFRTFRPDGTAGEMLTTSFQKADFLPAVETGELSNGLNVKWYDYHGNTCSEIDKVKFNRDFITEKVEIPAGASGNIGLVISGFIEVPADGIYTYSLLSDDGSMLWIDGKCIIENDGPHSPQEKTGQVALKKGMHKFDMRYFDYNGGCLNLFMIDADGVKKEAPASVFKH